MLHNAQRGRMVFMFCQFTASNRQTFSQNPSRVRNSTAQQKKVTPQRKRNIFRARRKAIITVGISRQMTENSKTSNNFDLRMSASSGALADRAGG